MTEGRSVSQRDHGFDFETAYTRRFQFPGRHGGRLRGMLEARASILAASILGARAMSSVPRCGNTDDHQGTTWPRPYASLATPMPRSRSNAPTWSQSSNTAVRSSSAAVSFNRRCPAQARGPELSSKAALRHRRFNVPHTDVQSFRSRRRKKNLIYSTQRT